VFPKAVGNYNDWMQVDVQAFNVSKPYLTYNASACGLKLNAKFSDKEILSIKF
jgi:hypothetical protein